MTEKEIKQEAEKLYQNNPKLRKAIKGLFKALGKEERLTGFSISGAGQEVYVSKEQIDKVNQITKSRRTKYSKQI